MKRVLTITWALALSACGGYLPPTRVPANQSPAFESFRAALQTYVDQTQPFRTDAAARGNAVQDQTSAGGSVDAVRLRQRTLAGTIETSVRPNAKPGDLFSTAVTDLIRRDLAAAFVGPKAAIIRDELADQNEGQGTGPIALSINLTVTLPRVPPVLLESLPWLPQQVGFAFTGRTLALCDVDGEVVIDYIPDAFPAWLAADRLQPSSESAIVDGVEPLFAVPGIAGSSRFALIMEQHDKLFHMTDPPRPTARP